MSGKINSQLRLLRHPKCSNIKRRKSRSDAKAKKSATGWFLLIGELWFWITLDRNKLATPNFHIIITRLGAFFCKSFRKIHKGLTEFWPFKYRSKNQRKQNKKTLYSSIWAPCFSKYLSILLQKLSMTLFISICEMFFVSVSMFQIWSRTSSFLSWYGKVWILKNNGLCKTGNPPHVKENYRLSERAVRFPANFKKNGYRVARKVTRHESMRLLPMG